MKNADNKGFTLIETLIAMAIFTVGVLGLFGMQSAVIKKNLAANTITSGATWATNEIELLLGQDYISLSENPNDRDGCVGIDDSPLNSDPARKVADSPPKASNTQPEYRIYWNVAKNCSMIRQSPSAPPGIPDAANERDEQKPKHIRVIVTTNRGNGEQQVAVFNYIKQNAKSN